jgi:hypothetical protein
MSQISKAGRILTRSPVGEGVSLIPSLTSYKAVEMVYD